MFVPFFQNADHHALHRLCNLKAQFGVHSFRLTYGMERSPCSSEMIRGVIADFVLTENTASKHITFGCMALDFGKLER
jgi:hypothetical protein